MRKSLGAVSRLISLCYCFLLLVFGKPLAAESPSQSYVLEPEVEVIELLRLSVPEDSRQAWLNAEKNSWEPWLAKQNGFLGRQLVWDQSKEEGTILISWASRKQWKDISKQELEAVQEAFEKLSRKGTGLLDGNPFPVIFEGEILPQ